jgi:acyl-CoA synthetase (AMP-forming)/AMP-acid ligase II
MMDFAVNHAIPTSVFDTARGAPARLSDGRQELGWADVLTAITAIDRWLTARGIAADAPVALEAANTLAGALSVLALLHRGSTFVLVPHPGPHAAAPVLPRFVTHRLRVVHPSQVSPAGDPLALDRPGSFLAVHAAEATHPLASGAPLRRHHLILRTSGSLAEPKWVVHTHAGMWANACNVVDRVGLATSDRVLMPVPLAHAYGLGACFLPALAAGACVDLLEGTNLVRFLERERVFRPTIAYLTPTLCAMAVRPRDPPDHYRHIVLAGDKLPAALRTQAEAMFRRVINLYGSTEMGAVCAGDARSPHAASAVTVGPPLPGVRMQIAPHAIGELGELGELGLGDAQLPVDGTPGGEVGELLCAYAHLCVGYVDLLGTPIAFDSPAHAGWYATRDLARIHADGAVEVLGRIDHATNRDGHLVMLGEIERVLARLPDVASAAVVLGAASLRGRRLIGFVTAQADRALDVAHLRRAALERLPGYAVPDELRVLPALPQLATGKLDRRALTHLIAPS